MATGRFTGEAMLPHADGSGVGCSGARRPRSSPVAGSSSSWRCSTSRWGARFRRAADDARTVKALSAREHEVVRLVAIGATGPEIADELQITHDTVRTHVRNAMDKHGARSRAHLVAKALGGGLGVH